MKCNVRCAMTIGAFALMLTASMMITACGDESSRPPSAPSPSPGPTGATIESDAALLVLVTEGQPFASYIRFPDVDVIRSGTSAHQPFVRVSMNQTAFAALQNGRLPAGMTFPTGSILFKEVLTGPGGSASVYTIMYKDRNRQRMAVGGIQPQSCRGVLRDQPRRRLHRLSFAGAGTAARPRANIRATA
jgi:hypothetical protein